MHAFLWQVDISLTKVATLFPTKSEFVIDMILNCTWHKRIFQGHEKMGGYTAQVLEL